MAKTTNQLGLYLRYRLSLAGYTAYELDGANPTTWYRRLNDPLHRLSVNDACYIAKLSGMTRDEAAELFFADIPEEGN